MLKVTKKQNRKLPAYNFSVVITTYKRPELLKKTLKSLNSQKGYKARVQIIVVDNDPEKSAERVFNSVIPKKKNFTSVYIVEKKSGPSYARNKGIGMAKHNYVIFLDDDIVVGNNFLKDFSRELTRNTEATMIGVKTVALSMNGRSLTKYKTLLKNNLWVLAESFYKTRKNYTLRFRDFLYSSCLCIVKSKLGNERFDEKAFGRRYGNLLIFAEDFELCSRLILKGHKLIYTPKIIVKHLIDTERFSFTYLARRFFLAGLEYRLMDSKLKSMTGYVEHSFNPLKYFYQVQKIFIRGARPDWLETIKYFLFDLGYLFGRTPNSIPDSP